ncbi:MAG: putative DNA binding domain-containing protein [Planctomycetaceae bacterium]|nr:putative DNA binding domain-containing protein [Planctomycetaceae bacterium]
MKRLTDEELEKLLDDSETDAFERKESFKGETLKKARQAVCAFANDLPNRKEPGVLFIGIKDDGTPSGEPITDELLRQLVEMKVDGNILPLPVMTVEKRILHGQEVAVVAVFPSDNPPVKYEGRIWIRTGPRRAIANEQEERILIERRRYKNTPFDIAPLPLAQLADLSRSSFENDFLPAAFAPDVLAENNRTYEERLAACKMIVAPDDPTPTRLGVLTLGKDPQHYVPGACIQFLRLAGTELVDPVMDGDLIEGTLPNLIRRTEDKLRSYNRAAYDISAGPHVITNDYPFLALQQILYNAVMHRTYENTNAPVRICWYDDRIEISNPGGPYGDVTVSNFGQPGFVDYRNPNIAAVMKTYGFIQRFGRGIYVAENEMRRNGNPPPEFRVDSSRVVVVLRKRTEPQSKDCKKP